MKKLILLALAAMTALLAIPAVAPAEALHVSSTGTFTVEGGASKIQRTAGNESTASSISGTGSFETTTTGTVELTFHGVHAPGVGDCNNVTGQTKTVRTTKLPFHLVTLPGKVPGVLITSLNGHFATYTCGVFGVQVAVTGNGILGTITSPACGGTSASATVSFKPAVAGHQVHTKTITNEAAPYGITTTIFGSASPSSMDAAANAGGVVNKTLTCT